MQQVSNPPKHRMGAGGMAKGANPSSSSSSGRRGGPAPSKSAPLKREKEGVARKVVKGSMTGSGLGGGSEGVITTLQPPPASKGAKVRATPSPVTQSLVQSGGTTYYYSGQQASPHTQLL